MMQSMTNMKKAYMLHLNNWHKQHQMNQGKARQSEKTVDFLLNNDDQ